MLTFAVAGIASLRADATFFGFLSNWDGSWFLRVARDGYPAHIPLDAAGHPVPTTTAFFPLFPLMTRVMSWVLPGPDALAGLVVAVSTAGLGVVLIHRLTTRLAGTAAADRTAVLVCFFPGSMVLSMLYSEGLMLAFAAGCLLALAQRRWVLAGICAGLATATRATALALVVACAWEAAVAIHSRREWRALAAPLLAPTGVIAFFAYLWARTGEPLAYAHAEQAWSVRPGLGRATRFLLIRFVQSPLDSVLVTSAALCVVFAIVTGVALIRRRWPVTLSIYAFSVVLLSVAARSDGLRPRDLLVAFPLLMAAGTVTPKRYLGLVQGVFAAGLATFLLLHNLNIWVQP